MQSLPSEMPLLPKLVWYRELASLLSNGVFLVLTTNLLTPFLNGNISGKSSSAVALLMSDILSSWEILLNHRCAFSSLAASLLSISALFELLTLSYAILDLVLVVLRETSPGRLQSHLKHTVFLP